MLSGVPVREHGRSRRPPLSENTHTHTPEKTFPHQYTEESAALKVSPEAIWILQPDSSWILLICSPPRPITADGPKQQPVRTHNSQAGPTTACQNPQQPVRTNNSQSGPTKASQNPQKPVKTNNSQSKPTTVSQNPQQSVRSPATQPGCG